MNLRFYHIWAYKIFYWLWTPIYQENPMLIQEVINFMTAWLERIKVQQELYGEEHEEF